jgi:exopolysaccharide production protein ExoQ
MMHDEARVSRGTRYGATIALDREIAARGMLSAVLRMFESCATIFVLMLISAAALPLFFHEGPNLDLAPATPLERACFWMAYAFTFLQALSRPQQMMRVVMRNPFVIGVALTAALSPLWSDDPQTSLRLAFAFCMWTIFGCFLAARYTSRQLLVHLGIALGILALASLATGLIAPDFGIESGFRGGAWRGVFTTKNVLGEMMLLAFVVFGVLVPGAGRLKFLPVVGIVLAVPLIALSKATAALLIVPVLVITIPVVLAFRKNNAVAALILCCLLVISAGASVLIVERDAVLSVLGKDATMTGRTVLWTQVASHIADRPLLGHGYGAFWEATSAASERVRAAIGWDTPHSHNGLLDVWLDLGLVGALSLIAGFALALERAWSGLRARTSVDGVWAMTFLVMLFLGNITESSIFQSYLMWAIFVSVACMQWPRVPSAVPSARAGARARPGTSESEVPMIPGRTS